MSIAAIVVRASGKAGARTDAAKVAAAMQGMTYQTPLGPRTFNATNHDADAGEYWGEMVMTPKYPMAVIKNPVYYNPQPAGE